MTPKDGPAAEPEECPRCGNDGSAFLISEWGYCWNCYTDIIDNTDFKPVP